MFRSTFRGVPTPRSGALASVRACALIGVALSLTLGGCQKDSASLFDEAQTLMAEGEAEPALELLRQAAAKDPGDAEIQFTIAMTLVRLGRTTEALFPLRKAAESEEYGAQAGIVLASSLAEGRNFEEAIAAADRVLDRFPEEEAALAIKANAAIALHQGEIALDAVDRMLAIQPDSLPFQHLRASALGEAARIDEAVVIFDRLMETEVEGDPIGPARACGSLAKLYIDKQMKDEAVARLESCAERFGDNPTFVQALVLMYDELEMREEAIDLLRAAVEDHPNDGSLLTALGTRLLVADRFEEAEALASEGLSENENPQRWAALATVRSAAGNVEGALEAILRTVALSDPPEQGHLFALADYQILLGHMDDAEQTQAQLTETLYRDAIEARILQEKGETEQALALYKDVLAHWPQNIGLRVHSALAAIDLGEVEQAKSDLLEATRQAPGDSDASIWLARLYFAEGKYADAADFARRQIHERGPTHPDPYLLAVRAYRRNNQPQRARQTLAAMADVRDGLFAGASIAEASRLAAKVEGPEAALELLEKLAADQELDLADPNAEPALIEVFQLLAAADRLDEAERRIQSLLAKHSDRATLRMISGRVQLLQGKLDAAEKSFARALELEPDHPASLAGQGLLLLEKGDLAGAGEAMNRAWEGDHHPDYGYMAAKLLIDQGNAEAGRDRLFELLTVHPDNAPAANDLAWLLAERGEQLDRAHGLAELAVRLAPGPEVLDTLGYVQLKQGEIAAATGTFRRVIDRWPAYATAGYHLALALEESGRLDEARAALEAALETSFPETEQAKALLARLSETQETVQQ